MFLCSSFPPTRIERLILETMCFKFEVDTGLRVVVKIGRALSRESDPVQVVEPFFSISLVR